MCIPMAVITIIIIVTGVIIIPVAMRILAIVFFFKLV